MPDRDVPVVVVTAAASNAGKTTVIESLVRTLSSRGVRVGYVKRAHHGVDPDSPGKDTHRVRSAGAAVTVLASPEAAAVFLRDPVRDPAALAELATGNADLDLVLVEGGRECTDLPRIAVVPDGGTLEVDAGTPLLAVVGRDVAVPDGVPLFAPDALGPLADLLPRRTA